MKRILRVLTCSGGFGKKEKEADQPEESKIEKSTAAAAPIDATSEVTAENGEHKSSNSSFEIIETNDPALVESSKKENNKETENDATEALESKNETEEKSAAVFKNVASTIEEKPVPAPEPVKEAEAAPAPVAEAAPVVEKIEAQTQAEPVVVQSSAVPAELAQEAADLQKMTVAEEKVSLAEEVKTLPKEEPLNFAKALKTPPAEVKKVEEDEKKVENVKLDDLENEEADSGNVSEEKSAEESFEKIQAISDECEKAVKRTSTEIEALRAEILRNILIAKELENEKEAASDEKLDIPAENPATELNASQTKNADTPNKKSKKRKHKVQKPKHQKW